MNRKKWIILGIDLLIAIFIVFVIIFIINNNKKSKELSSSKVVSEFKEYFNSKDEKVIYFTSNNDSYSSLQTPILESIDSDYEIDILTINKDEIKDIELDKITSYLKIDEDTPNIIIVKNGEVIATKEDFIDGYNLVKYFIENNVLDEDSEYLAEKYLTIIDYDKFNELYNGTDMFIVTLGQTSCSHCIATKPELSYIAEKYGITINYIDLTELNETEYSSLSSMVADMNYTESIGTPLTLIVKDKSLVNYVEGEAPTSKFVKTFKTAGIIK